MGAPRNNQNGVRFQKGNKIACKNKGKKQRKTLIKESMGLDLPDITTLLERNILEFLSSKNRNERLLACRYFAPFIKSKKRYQTVAQQEKCIVNIVHGQSDKL